MVSQKIRFCTSRDGVSIAYAITGRGPVLVRAPHFLTHIEHDLATPFRNHWIEALSRHFTLVRFDPRGCGLSDRDPPEHSLDRWVEDLEAVVDSAGLERFALLGPSQGGAAAIEYVVRHPGRVTHLALYGAFARGKLARGSEREREDALAQLKLVELGWASEDPAYRQVFAAQMMPGASAETRESLTGMMQVSASARDAVGMVRMVHDIDVVGKARRVNVPTLVFHAIGDRRVPYEEGRLLATLVPGARLVSLESINHMLPPGDPALDVFVQELRSFIHPPGHRDLLDLSGREREVLGQLCLGLDNRMIATRLGIAEKTVRNHLTRIYEKMHVRRRGEAIVRAREVGLEAAASAGR